MNRGVFGFVDRMDARLISPGLAELVQAGGTVADPHPAVFLHMTHLTAFRITAFHNGSSIPVPMDSAVRRSGLLHSLEKGWPRSRWQPPLGPEQIDCVKVRFVIKFFDVDIIDGLLFLDSFHTYRVYVRLFLAIFQKDFGIQGRLKDFPGALVV